MAKNIVICCDGTNNEFGDRNSNVIKLFDLLDLNSPNQVAYYGSGLGTMGEIDDLSAWEKIGRSFNLLMESMIGKGIFQNIYEAYSYLMDTYESGDKIYIFGFSRGAYTAKAVCAMVHMFGLLPKNNYDGIFHIIKRIKKTSPEDFALAKKFKSTFSRDIKIHFVGLWDCVNSVGGYNPIHLPYSATNPSIINARHAVSIDERRCFFRTNLWGEPQPHQNLLEVWFSGVHSDVGGGYKVTESDLSNITLAWMAKESELFGLKLEPSKTRQVYTKDHNALAMMHNELNNGFMGLVWKLVEYLPKPYKERQADGNWKTKWKLYKQSPRFIPEESILYESVLKRLHDNKSEYKPTNLPTKYSVLESSLEGSQQPNKTI